MHALYIVELEEDEKNELKALLSGGSPRVRMAKRAQILLAADRGLTTEEIAFSVGAGTSTVYRTRRKYVEGGLTHALTERRRPGGVRKLTHKEGALLSALACAPTRRPAERGGRSSCWQAASCGSQITRVYRRRPFGVGSRRTT